MENVQGTPDLENRVRIPGYSRIAGASENYERGTELAADSIQSNGGGDKSSTLPTTTLQGCQIQ